MFNFYQIVTSPYMKHLNFLSKKQTKFSNIKGERISAYNNNTLEYVNQNLDENYDVEDDCDIKSLHYRKNSNFLSVKKDELSNIQVTKEFVEDYNTILEYQDILPYAHIILNILEFQRITNYYNYSKESDKEDIALELIKHYQNKYNNTLWKTLTDCDRSPQKIVNLIWYIYYNIVDMKENTISLKLKQILNETIRILVCILKSFYIDKNTPFYTNNDRKPQSFYSYYTLFDTINKIKSSSEQKMNEIAKKFPLLTLINIKDIYKEINKEANNCWNECMIKYSRIGRYFKTNTYKQTLYNETNKLAQKVRDAFCSFKKSFLKEMEENKWDALNTSGEKEIDALYNAILEEIKEAYKLGLGHIFYDEYGKKINENQPEVATQETKQNSINDKVNFSDLIQIAEGISKNKPVPYGYINPVSQLGKWLLENIEFQSTGKVKKMSVEVWNDVLKYNSDPEKLLSTNKNNETYIQQIKEYSNKLDTIMIDIMKQKQDLSNDIELLQALSIYTNNKIDNNGNLLNVIKPNLKLSRLNDLINDEIGYTEKNLTTSWYLFGFDKTKKAKLLNNRNNACTEKYNSSQPKSKISTKISEVASNQLPNISVDPDSNKTESKYSKETIIKDRSEHINNVIKRNQLLKSNQKYNQNYL